MTAIPEREREGPTRNPLEAFLDDVSRLKERGSILIHCGDLLEYNDPRFTDAIQAAKMERGAVLRIIAPPILVEDEGDRNGILRLRDLGLTDELLYSFSLGLTTYYYLIETEEGPIYYKGAYSDGFSTPVAERREESPEEIMTRVYRKYAMASSHAPMQVKETPPSSPTEALLKEFETSADIIKEYGSRVPGRELLPFVTTRGGLLSLMTRRDSIALIEPHELLRLGGDLLRPSPSRS